MKNPGTTKLIGIALFGLTAASVVFYPAISSINPPINPPGIDYVQPSIAIERPKVEVVFVLDTTSSMSGLIDAAKEKIWSIASSMASAQPAPDIHMGLVAFRDRGDAYVTKVVDLSQDLDSMYATLIDFKAEGGGDGPESVNQALYDAVHSISWSQDPNSYKVIFLVGDAPPHMDYQNDVKFPQTLSIATRKGIVVNTIQCGQHVETQQVWQMIASNTDGEYFNVAQDGSAVAIATPFDDEIAALSEELDETRLFFGDAEEKVKHRKKIDATSKLHAKSSVQSRARRAVYNATAAGEANLLGESDLVAAVESGRIDVTEIEAEVLPESLQALSKDELAEVVASTSVKRGELNQQIKELAAKRQSYLEVQVEASGTAEDTLDHKIYQAVRVQAAEAADIEYAAEPQY